MSAAEQRKASEIFNAYDYDKSGHIDATELRELLVELQWAMDEKTLDDFIKEQVGADNKRVSLAAFQEIYGLMAAKQPSSVRKMITITTGNGDEKAKNNIVVDDLLELEADTRYLFDGYDMGNGKINLAGLRRVMRDMGLPDVDGDDYEAQVAMHMEMADVNQDGLIDFQEFAGYRNSILDYFYQQDKQAEKRQLTESNADKSPWAEWKFAD